MKSAAKVMAFWLFIQYQIGDSVAQSGNEKMAVPENFWHLKGVKTGSEKVTNGMEINPRIMVLICLSEICMISQYYAREMQILERKSGADSVFFAGFFPNPFSVDSSIREFARDNKLDFPLFRDSLGLFSSFHSITTTPEVLVFRDGKKLYQGRFDDFYVAIGRQRGFTRFRFLENALNKIKKNENPEKPFVKPVGCLIDFRLWKK